MLKVALQKAVFPAAAFFFLAFAISMQVLLKDLGFWWGPSEIWRPLFIVWGVFLALFLCLRLFSRDEKKAFALAFFLGGAFFLYERILMSGFKPLGGLVLLLSGMMIGAVLIRASDKARILSVEIVSALIVISLTQSASGFVNYLRLIPGGAPLPPRPELFSAAAVHAAQPLPDIYFVMLDGYARQDTMQRLFSYDNAPFLSALEQAGFYVTRSGLSSYPQTVYSISSTLNMNYLGDDLKTPEPDYRDQKPLHAHYMRPRFLALLKSQGYETHVLSMAWNLDADFDPLKTELRSPDVNLTGTVRVWQQTPLHQIFTLLFGADRRFLNLRRDVQDAFRRNLDGLNTLAAKGSGARPKFVFAHFLSPHPPFVFDEKGEISANGAPLAPVVYEDRKRQPFENMYGEPWIDHYKRGYPVQIRYLNAEMLKFVRGALEVKGGRPKVILIQSDHGARIEYEPDCAAAALATYANFNAVYFSDGDYRGLDDTISPINTFRVVANKYFGLGLPMLEKKQWCRHSATPYNFTDVTVGIAAQEAAMSAR